MNHTFTRSIALLAILLLPAFVFAQCIMYPVSFNERINNARSALLGKITDQHCYTDAKGNIYTSNKVQVTAWMKNQSNASEVYVITIGGVVDGKAQISYPAVQLQKGQEYFFMLENDNALVDDKTVRATHPNTIQSMPYADAQGSWLYQDGKYADVFFGKFSEAELIQKVTTATGLQPRKPDGTVYNARPVIQARGNNTLEITSFGPNPTNAGTVNPADYLTINGSGFGNTVGTVEFKNADDGGATYITPPTSTDYISWTDNQIIVKVPTGYNSTTNSNGNAGTGTFRVNGTFVSPQALIVNYSHISLISNFRNFPAPTRQRYYLRNLDGIGGYTFTYNTNFASNTAAVAAFERSLTTWTCSTGINWRAAGTTSVGYAGDGVNVVLYDATLPAGVLARATSRFNGSAIDGSCDLDNTVWWLSEVDVQVLPSGVTWQYGPGNAVPGQYDFQTVLTHELGHAHGLGHRIAPGELMNYALGSGINIRIPSTVEIQGAQAKMAYSTVPTCFNPVGSGTPMIAASCPLPIKLMSFTGELKKYGVELNWKTATEINSDRFEVQRSSNGVEFTTIGRVQAKGNSVSESAYRFIDPNPMKGVNYYRLKMIDKDGSFEYSAVISVKVNELLSEFIVFPNPVKGELQISSANKGTLNLVDGNGKLVRRFKVNIGNNAIPVNDLSSGVYYLSDPSSGMKLRLMILH